MAPSISEARIQEKKFQPRNPYLQQVLSRNFFNTESFTETAVNNNNIG